jgi:lysozyme
MPYNESLFGNGHSFDRIILPAGMELITRWELFKPRRYKDAHKSGFKWAIGYGHVEGGDNEPIIIPEDMVITEPEARAIFLLDLESKARFIRAKLGNVPVNSYMFSALVSLVYNIGEGNFEESPVLKALHDLKYVKAGAKFNRHNKAWIDAVMRDNNDEPILDEAGKEIPILLPDGTNKKELREVNGLTLRRGDEMSLFARKIMLAA